MHMTKRCGHVAAMALMLVVGGAGSALAQGGRDAALPFANTYRRPSVSPYNNLATFSNNPQVAGSIYQQMVLPQQQQQQQLTQLQQGRQLGKLQNQVQQIQRDTSGRQVDETIRPTGHRATYMNYSHFYPTAR